VRRLNKIKNAAAIPGLSRERSFHSLCFVQVSGFSSLLLALESVKRE
jgi:hypothetical protein